MILVEPPCLQQRTIRRWDSLFVLPVCLLDIRGKSLLQTWRNLDTTSTLVTMLTVRVSHLVSVKAVGSPSPLLAKLEYDHLTKSLKRASGDNGVCSCYICQAGRSKNLKRKIKKPGHKSDTIEAPPKAISVCGTCYQKVGRGIRHKCYVSEAPFQLC